MLFRSDEKDKALKELGSTAEITRFKGLGEISPDEFKAFIGEQIKLDPVRISSNDQIAELLLFYMGKNTPERQEFIIENLKVEGDLFEETIDNEAKRTEKSILEIEEEALA